MSWTELNTQRILGKPYESLRKIDLAINSEETRGRSTTKIIVNICIAMSLPQTEGHIFAWPGTVEIWVTEWNTRQNNNKNVIGHGEKHHSSKQESHEKACDRNAVFETTKYTKITCGLGLFEFFDYFWPVFRYSCAGSKVSIPARAIILRNCFWTLSWHSMLSVTALTWTNNTQRNNFIM